MLSSLFSGRTLSWSSFVFFLWQVERHREHLINYIIFLRITPFLPNWFINITSPVINVPLKVFFIGTFLGKASSSQAVRTRLMETARPGFCALYRHASTVCKWWPQSLAYVNSCSEMFVGCVDLNIFCYFLKVRALDVFYFVFIYFLSFEDRTRSIWRFPG